MRRGRRRSNTVSALSARTSTSPPCARATSRTIYKSQPEATVGIVAARLRRASLERIKNLVQSRSLDGRSAVHHLNVNVGLLAGKHHTDRLALRPVLDRVRNQGYGAFAAGVDRPSVLECRLLPPAQAVAHNGSPAAALAHQQTRSPKSTLANAISIPNPNLVRLKSTKSSNSAFIEAPLRISRDAASDTSAPALSAPRVTERL